MAAPVPVASYGNNSEVAKGVRSQLLPDFDVTHICLTLNAAEAELPALCAGALETTASSGLGNNASLMSNDTVAETPAPQASSVMDLLCMYCSPLLLVQPHPAQGPVSHHRTVGALVESAQSCRVCITIQAYWSLGHLQKRFSDLEGEGAGSLPLELRVASPGHCATGVQWFLLSGSITTDKHKFAVNFEVTITTHVQAGPASNNPLWSGTESSLRQKIAVTKSWYDNCATNHPECSPSHGQYPGRLIDVGAHGQEPRLISARNCITKKPAYTTLSHCWGDVTPLVATTANMEQLFQGIPIDSLPRTFREAILVTRGLGIPYIWIDSLCIIQDDLEDWRMEAARMKDTYSCSAVTISALNAQNCTHGCFVDNDSDSFNSAEEKARVNQKLVLPLGAQNGIPIRIYEGDIQHPLRNATLRMRGWTLQEELLAHREIICTRPEIRWRCQRATRTEAGHEFSNKGSTSLWTHQSPHAEPRRLWCNWMTDYSSRAFTFETDRLRALVGIIHHYGRQTGYHHVLASWRETMIDDLLWVRGRNIVKPPPIAGLAIPSWSWILRAKNIKFDFWTTSISRKSPIIIEDTTTVIEASADWDGEPMLSNLVASNLVLEGPVQQMRLRVDPRAMNFNPHYLKVGDEEPDLSPNPIPWQCAGLFDQEDVRQDEIFTCLLMRSASLLEKDDGPFMWETFLILAPEQEGVFRRVGVAMLMSSETGFSGAIRRRIRLV